MKILDEECITKWSCNDEGKPSDFELRLEEICGKSNNRSGK